MRITSISNSVQKKQNFGQLKPQSAEVAEHIAKLFRTSTDKKQRFDKFFKEVEARQSKNTQKDIEFFLDDLGLGEQELGIKIGKPKDAMPFKFYMPITEPLENVPFKLLEKAEMMVTPQKPQPPKGLLIQEGSLPPKTK